VKRVTNASKSFVAWNRFDLARTHFITSSLRFREPQSINLGEGFCVEALDQKIRETGPRFAGRFIACSANLSTVVDIDRR
jgi:hypothetical protein